MEAAKASAEKACNAGGSQAAYNCALVKNFDAAQVVEALTYVAIGMLIAEIPRLYYLCLLCGYCCCGGKAKDTAADRAKLKTAMEALIVSLLLSIVLIVVITLAAGGSFGGVMHFLLSYIIDIVFALWWRMDIMKWIDNKKAIEGSA